MTVVGPTLTLRRPPAKAFEGHSGSVEDVRFHPTSADGAILCSVGADRVLAFWDARAGCTPTHKLLNVHSDEINCVSWCPTNSNLILTGSRSAYLCTCFFTPVY